MKTPILSAIAALAISAVGITWAARDGSGTYVLPAGNPVSTGTTISSTWANATLSDIATALTNSLSKDGQTVPSANLPMGGFKHTNVATATARNQYAAASQVQDSSMNVLGSVIGTNTITASLNPAITNYSAGTVVTLTPAGNNTGATTLAVNGLAALDVQKADGDALISGDLVSGVPALLVLDAGADDWILINPQASTNGIAISDLARLSQVNNFTAAQTIGGSSSAKLNLNAADSIGDAYISFYESNGTTRKAYVGFGNSGDDTFIIQNEESGANLELRTTGGGAVQVNGSAVLTTGSSLNASNLGSGTVPDARISSSSVTQHANAVASAVSGGTAMQANARNITVKAGTTKTLSSSAPSGGSDGDIWYRY
jgi:hypothetical protein